MTRGKIGEKRRRVADDAASLSRRVSASRDSGSNEAGARARKSVN